MDIASCPWGSFTPGTVKFCEEHLCAWITQPANTWSNLFYILSGILVIKNARSKSLYDLQAIGVIAILVGIGSFFFHASSTFIGEFCDLAAMFLFANYLLFFNIKRIWTVPKTWLIWSYSLSNIFSLILLLLVPPIGIATFTAQITVVVLLEAYIRFSQKNRTWTYHYLRYLVFFFVLSFTAWNLDIRGIWCDPQNHWIQGHALWHTLNSACFWFAYKFYAQFTPPKSAT